MECINHSKLEYYGVNPGAVRYGNFINYYKFHPVEERLKLLPQNVWDSGSKHICLDIGCNSGDLTFAINKYLSEMNIHLQMLAVDMDPSLIKRAIENYECHNITFKSIDFMNTRSRQELLESYLKSQNTDKFDIAFCFSVTMWIHINHGDEGLMEFLAVICSISHMIVLEPQPWKCYRKAVRRLKRSNEIFPKYEDLHLRSDVESAIINKILKCGFQYVKETLENKWGRKLYVFKKCKF